MHRCLLSILIALVAALPLLPLGGCGGGGGGGFTPTVDVMIVHAWSAEFLDDVVAKLQAQGTLASVNAFDASVGTPSMPDLTDFDAVLVGSDDSFADPAALGDLLADYVDLGGAVVLTMFTFENGITLDGRWESENYYVIPESNTVSGDGPIALGAFTAGHPIMGGVASFSGGTSSYRPDVLVPPPFTLVASWDDGRPLVMTRLIGAARRADLGFFPPSSDARVDFWDSATDGARLMANALRWVAGDL